MLCNNYITELLELQDVTVEKIENSEKSKKVYIKLNRKEVSCPCCNTKTSKIHDYRTQSINDCNTFGKNLILVLRKRRYVCPECDKKFAEPNTFLPRYHRMTNRLSATVIDKLREERSFTSVAKEVGLSVSTVIRIFDLVQYPKLTVCPTALSIDEFKGNTGGEKYNVILCDAANKQVLDILPQRKEAFLIDYFKKLDRSSAKYFVSDMWTTYFEISKHFFNKATFLVDKYHWVRQVIWAFEAVRKEVQKTLKPELRKYFKRSRSLLIKRPQHLTDEQKKSVDLMLWYSSRLSEAYSIKNWFFEIFDRSEPELAKAELTNWIKCVKDSELIPFAKCANAYSNWYAGILNSLDSIYTNGFTEGCNNKIKVLKRNAYGYRNFHRFRNRILHIFSHQRAA